MRLYSSSQSTDRRMIYLLNTPILTDYGLWHFEGPLSPETARAMLSGQEPISAIGHAATAAWVSELLQRPVPANRIAVRLQPGDSALVFRLTQRLPEGQILNLDQLRDLPYEFGWLHYHSPSLAACA